MTSPCPGGAKSWCRKENTQSAKAAKHGQLESVTESFLASIFHSNLCQMLQGFTVRNPCTETDHHWG